MGKVGGLEREHATLCQIYVMLEPSAKDSLTPTTVQTSIGRPPKLQQSQGSGLRSRQQRGNTWNWPLLELGARLDVPTGETKPFTSDNRDGGAKAQKPKKAGKIQTGFVIFMTLARFVLATVQGSSRYIRVRGPGFLR